MAAARSRQPPALDLQKSGPPIMAAARSRQPPACTGNPFDKRSLWTLRGLSGPPQIFLVSFGEPPTRETAQGKCFDGSPPPSFRGRKIYLVGRAESSGDHQKVPKGSRIVQTTIKEYGTWSRKAPSSRPYGQPFLEPPVYLERTFCGYFCITHIRLSWQIWDLLDLTGHLGKSLKIRARQNGRRALSAASGTRFTKIRGPSERPPRALPTIPGVFRGASDPRNSSGEVLGWIPPPELSREENILSRTCRAQWRPPEGSKRLPDSPNDHQRIWNMVPEGSQ